MYLYDKLGKAEQNKFNPILFGTKDKAGLFIKDSFGNITPNPNFKQIFDISLFNGIKDTNTGNGTVYDKMGKSDLFITQLIAFSKSFNSETNVKDNAEVGSYFMKTPSDAPKNFIITSNKYKVPSLSFEQTDVDNYINKIILNKIPKTVNEKLDKYNIKEVIIPANLKLLEEYKSKILNVNSFSFQRFRLPQDISWEEQFVFFILCAQLPWIYCVGKPDTSLSVTQQSVTQLLTFSTTSCHAGSSPMRTPESAVAGSL